MLIDNLYEIMELREDDNKWIFRVRIDAHSEIFKGHFPGMPVMPGVCMLYVIKGCLSQIMGRMVSLATIGECKFLASILPDKDNLVDIEAQLEENNLVCRVLQNGNVMLKLKATLA